MYFFELDESEGFILLGRRREKDFLSTWALLEDQVLASCILLPEAPSTRAVMVTRGRGKATQLRQGDAVSVLDALSRGGLV